MPFGTVKLLDGRELPMIAFGTGSTMKYKDVTDYVEQALDNGFCHIDTAAFYQTEKYIGIALRESGLPRSSVYITTKYSNKDVTVRESMRNSLENLGLTFVDLYLVHFPGTLEDIEIGWREFESLKEDGLAKSIGVSNFSLEQLQLLFKTAREKPVVNQIELHPYNYAENKELLAYCAKQGIVVEAYGSLNSITQNPGGPVDAVVDAIANRIDATPNQVIFAWVKSKRAAIVTTSRSKERLHEYLAVADLPPLTPEEIAAIDEAGAQGPPSASRVARTGKAVMVLVLIILAALRLYSGTGIFFRALRLA
ncbi:NADP-dependent oxidoreductase domain-containing protein [Melanogaster broomeanus]|nr:NADP-dependent oxidoreductase domain-containing protein [Melanogaster broomeanus]